MPKTTQLTLPLQSKPGVLAKVARALADAGVNITALSAGDRGSSGKLRIVVNNPGRAKRALRAAKLRANEEPAFVVRLRNKGHGRSGGGKAREGADQHQVRVRDDGRPERGRRADRVQSGEGAAVAPLNASANRGRAGSVL